MSLQDLKDRIEGQTQIADDLEREYDDSDGDLTLMCESEFEKGRLSGLSEALSLIGEGDGR